MVDPGARCCSVSTGPVRSLDWSPGPGWLDDEWVGGKGSRLSLARLGPVAAAP